jgi:hypothetical protein
MTTATGATTACRANFGAAGRRRRTRFAILSFVVAAALLTWMIVAHVPAAWRLLLFAPIAGGTLSGLQVRRNTCVAMAAMGAVENEDLSITRVEAAVASESRRVARTIFRDAVLIGGAGGLLAAATALVS